MKIKILYEDKDLLVIDKPSAVMVHSDGKTKKETISSWFLKKYPKIKNVGESILVNGKEIKKPGIVHRLDQETSGVLILVKNQKTYEFIKNQFQNRKIKKTYNALVSGFFKNSEGVVDKPIGRSPSDFRRRLAGRGARGELKEALTKYKVIKNIEIQKHKFSYLEIFPKTGRTHQIRVHMKFLSHPVACDSLYNPKTFCPLKIARLALHARKIEFQLPAGNILKIEAPLPKEIEELIK